GAEEGCRIFNKVTGEWELLETDFDNVEIKEIFGIPVPVIKKETMITEKLMFNRSQDQEDIKQMQ
ncbi:MAG: hypothetical protein WBB68_00825, partial [Candidatus Moraniibacteriota bacterium]